MPSARARQQRPDGLSTGIATGLVAQLAQIPMALIVMFVEKTAMGGSISAVQGVFYLPILFSGFTQWVFMLPLAAWLRAKGRPATARGVVFVGMAALVVSIFVAAKMVLSAHLRAID
jgi:hypothetical protein